mmetsp:Transcript_2986/g.10703  ORF Transcript_2986/g.10703 Transcript_2986/m.10703 type:complete len:651 (+) Transcript_2986:1166-3118(+)
MTPFVCVAPLRARPRSRTWRELLVDDHHVRAQGLRARECICSCPSRPRVAKRRWRPPAPKESKEFGASHCESQRCGTEVGTATWHLCGSIVLPFSAGSRGPVRRGGLSGGVSTGAIVRAVVHLRPHRPVRRCGHSVDCPVTMDRSALMFLVSSISPGGYPADLFVDAVSEELECAICMQTLRDPIGCAEGHTVCRSCGARALATRPECPVCRRHLTLATATKSRPLIALIDSLRVRCPHHDVVASGGAACAAGGGCTWTGKLGDLDAHLKRDCGFVLVDCRFAGCPQHTGRRLLRRDAGHHEASCGWRTAACSMCTRIVTVRAMDAHARNLCPKRKVKCGDAPEPVAGEDLWSAALGDAVQRDGCGAVLAADELDWHRERDCPMQHVGCVVPGCTVRTRRRDMATHMESAVMAHEFLSLRRKAQHLSRQLDTTLAALKAANDELRARDTEMFVFFTTYNGTVPPRVSSRWASRTFVSVGLPWRVVLTFEHRDVSDATSGVQVLASLEPLETTSVGYDMYTVPPSLEATLCILDADLRTPKLQSRVSYRREEAFDILKAGYGATVPKYSVQSGTLNFDRPFIENIQDYAELAHPGTDSMARILRFGVSVRRTEPAAVMVEMPPESAGGSSGGSGADCGASGGAGGADDLLG